MRGYSGGCSHGCSWGMHGCLAHHASPLLLGGMRGCSGGPCEWLLPGPGGHAWDLTLTEDTVNEQIQFSLYLVECKSLYLLACFFKLRSKHEKVT